MGFTIRIATDEEGKTSVQYIDNGGTVTFSPDKNVGVDTLENRIRSWFKTKFQRIMHQRKIDNAVMSVHVKEQKKSQKSGEPYYGLGYKKEPKGRGMYYPQESGTPAVKEVSYELTFAGVSSEVLKILAESIRNEFDQESVLVHDRNTNRSYFKYKNTSGETQEEESRYRSSALYSPREARKILRNSKKVSSRAEISGYSRLRKKTRSKSG